MVHSLDPLSPQELGAHVLNYLKLTVTQLFLFTFVKNPVQVLSKQKDAHQIRDGQAASNEAVFFNDSSTNQESLGN